MTPRDFDDRAAWQFHPPKHAECLDAAGVLYCTKPLGHDGDHVHHHVINENILGRWRNEPWAYEDYDSIGRALRELYRSLA